MSEEGSRHNLRFGGGSMSRVRVEFLPRFSSEEIREVLGGKPKIVVKIIQNRDKIHVTPFGMTPPTTTGHLNPMIILGCELRQSGDGVPVILKIE